MTPRAPFTLPIYIEFTNFGIPSIWADKHTEVYDNVDRFWERIRVLNQNGVSINFDGGIIFTSNSVFILKAANIASVCRGRAPRECDIKANNTNSLVRQQN